MRRAAILLVCLLAGLSAFGENTVAPGGSRPLQDGIYLYVCSYPGGGQGNLVQFNAETGEKVLALSGADKPVDVDVGPGGDLFVTDEVTSSVRRFNHATGEPDDDPYGETASRLYLGDPRGLAFGPDDHLYVANVPFVPDAKVLEFDENGTFVQVLPDDAETLAAIEDVACDRGGSVYVTQWFAAVYSPNPGVYKFTGDGWVLFGETDNLESPWGLTFGPDGDLYVAEDSAEATGVYRYDGATGASKGVFGQTGLADKLGLPRYLAFGPDNDLYVSDDNDSTVRKFSGPLKPDAGKFLDVFGETSGNVPGPIGLVFSGAPQAAELLIERLENGDMLLTLTGTKGRSYELRYTSDPTVSDFTQWTFGATIQLEGETSGSWTDAAPAVSGRFYKAKEQ